MSIRLMTKVFDRYDGGGGELLLALALSDHASDDGSRIYPGIKSLSQKTRQSERTVQYQIRRMEESGWLLLVGEGHGGKGQHREYRICPDWIKGADSAPVQILHPVQSTTPKGATDDTKGCNPQHQRVQPAAPAINHTRIIIEPSLNHHVVLGGYSDDFERAWVLYPKRPGVNKVAAYKAWKARLNAGYAAEQMISATAAYAACCAAERKNPKHIKLPATFYGPDLHFLVDMTPIKPTGTGSLNLLPTDSPRIREIRADNQDEWPDWMRDDVEVVHAG